MVTRITGNEALHEAAKTHFQSLYTKDVHYRPKLDHLCFDKVGEPARRLLESEFAKGEIYSCLKDCDGDKASGPDGFNMTIFQSFWHEVKLDVLNFFSDFNRHGSFVKPINSTFIVLIPKKEGPIVSLTSSQSA